MFRTVCKHLGSLKIALLLLAVIICAAGIGTWLESRYSAEVARRYVYGNIWFDCWLTMLVVNLFCAAAIRYPWKPHQTGFVITHAGIITLLIGGMIDRHWGIEGYMGLERGRPSTNLMELRVQQLLVAVTDNNSTETARTPLVTKELEAMARPADRKFTAKSPSPDVKVEVLDVQNVSRAREVVASPTGKPAVHLIMRGPMMGVQDRWLMLNENVDEGPATMSFTAGMPPPVAAAPAPVKEGMVPRRERYYVFAKMEADNVMLRERVGDPTNAVIKFSVSEKGDDAALKLKLFDKEFSVPMKGNEQKDFALEGLADWKVFIIRYFPNFRMIDGKPASLNDKPENPAIFFDLIGPLVKATEPVVNAHGGPEMNPAKGANALDLYLGQDGKLRYVWKSRTKGEFSGEMEKGKPVPMYAPPGAEFLVDNFMPQAEVKMVWKPVLADAMVQMEGVRPALQCRVTVGNDWKEVWVGYMELMGVLTTKNAAGETTLDLPNEFREHVEVGGRKVDLTFINQFRILPFTVSLLKFYAPHPEGEDDSNTFTAFESTLAFDEHRDLVELNPDATVLKEEGVVETKPFPLWCAIIDETPAEIVVELPSREQRTIPRSDIFHYVKRTHKIYMNYPTTYPVTWYGPWVGTSYKFSQAGHDMPRNPDFSNVQILRDPGWMPKWVGCLMICFGIFTMFYLKPYFHRKPAAAAPPAGNDSQKKVKGKGKMAEREKSGAATVRSDG